MVEKLDDLTRILDIDRSGTLSQIVNFLPNLEEATSYPAEGVQTSRSICMSGIGGSAMAADVMMDYATYRSSIPVFVNRNVTLPKWVGKGTLSIITSYSGNTQEALDVLKASLDAGCDICCITSGGKLLKHCEESGIAYVKVPSGIQPRAALGYLLGALSSIMEKVGASTPATDFRKASQTLRLAVERYSPDSIFEHNLAKKFAIAIEKFVPAIYAPRNIRSVAVRWQNQINENSKMVAFSGEIPEMNHNQMVGWLQGDRCQACRPLFLLPSMMDKTVERMTMVTIEMFNEAGLEPIVVPLHGNSHAENLLAGIVLGDHVSYYLAVLKCFDPGPVPVIQDFKTRIA